MESKTHIEKFIIFLRTEIELQLLHKRPSSLKLGFAEALQTDKKILNHELLRREKLQYFPKINKT